MHLPKPFTEGHSMCPHCAERTSSPVPSGPFAIMLAGLDLLSKTFQLCQDPGRSEPSPPWCALDQSLRKKC